MCDFSDVNVMEMQMHKKHSAQSILLGKDTFGVTVYPNVDYAFIVALIVILEEINEDRSDNDWMQKESLCRNLIRNHFF